jgi:PGF-pre-PGF domain-containing protein
MRHNFIFGINKRAHSRQILAIIITAVAIALLIISGPANAFNLTLGTPSNTTPTQGAVISFTANVTIESNERVPIQNLSLNFSNGTTCYFGLNGSFLTPAECAGLNITPMNDTINYDEGNLTFNFTGNGSVYDYGYGFGYTGTGTLSYNVTLNTSVFGVGQLNFSLSAHLTSNTFTSAQKNINIISSDTVAPAVTINTPAAGTNYSSSGTVVFNATVTDDTSVANVTFNISNATSSSFLLSASNGGGNWWNASLAASALSEGAHVVRVIANDTLGYTNSTQTSTFTVDKSAPYVGDFGTQYGQWGYGVLHNEDGFLSTASGNNLINLSINLSDAITAVANVTFNMSDVCTGVTVTKTSSAGGLWWANCTVNVNGLFTQKNITLTVCDVVGNCNSTSIYRTIMLYNMTVPNGQSGVMQFGSDTTNLSTQTDLSNVSYVLDIELNGSMLSGQPWSGFANAVLFNFSSVDFTDPAIGPKFAGLATAIQINISAPNSFGVNRIYVNTSYFAELNTTTTITLYNLPFISRPNITSDPDITNAGITIINWAPGGTQGNLTFSVARFSGYNFSDVIVPIITVVNPISTFNTSNSAILMNVTINGTGTQLSAAYFYLNGGMIANYTGSSNSANCSNVSAGSEMFRCLFTYNLSGDGNYALTVVAYDYGGSSPGNNATSDARTFTYDHTEPIVTISSPVDNYRVYNITSVTFAFVDSLMNNASCKLIVNNSLYGTNGSVINNTATTIVLNTSLVESTYALKVNCTDILGNIGTSALQTLIIDRTAPVITATPTATGTSSSTTTGAATITATTDENSTCWRSTTDFNATDVSGATVMSGTDTTHTFTVDYTADGTIGPYYISCRDIASNNMTTSNSTGSIAVTVTEARSSGGGGGGSITNPSTSQTWDVFAPGVAKIMTINSDDFGIKEITFEVIDAAGNVRIEVIKLSGKPASVADIIGKVFRYLQIRSTNLADANIKGVVKIKFQVTKSWLAANGLDASSIVLKRYANNAWTDLKTTLLSSDDKYAYYEAESPGFSYFAIGTRTELTAFAIIDMIRAFYQGKSTLTQFELIDKVREFYAKSK